jgi:hypothetical protein
MSAEYYVYVHYKISDNKPFYVGKGKGRRAWSLAGRSTYWNNVKSKHGYNVEIVFENLTEEEAFQCEIDSILEFKYFGFDLVNFTNGGEGTSGVKQSSETIAKRVSKNTGKTRTPEQRLRISEALTGKKRTDVQRKTQSERSKGKSRSMSAVLKAAVSNTGKKRSVKSRQKMSDAAKLVAEKSNLSNRTILRNMDKTIYTFLHPEIGQFIGTRLDFSEKYNIKIGTIQNYFNRRSTRPNVTIKGWTIQWQA